MLTLCDLGYLSLKVQYDRPVLSWDHTGLTTTTADWIQLSPCPQPQPGDLLQQRNFEEPKGVSIKTSFYWPPDPGAAAGYTAPLIRWVQTVIKGYTSEPIVLHDWYSQTYRPEHHNFGENFLFEPRLEQGLSAGLLNELRAQNIRLIHVVATEVERGKYVATHVATYGFEDRPFLPGDLDDDKDVDLRDLTMFAPRWLQFTCDTCGGADLTGDGRVALDDLCEFANNWLARP
jgi:hypothetical protein